MPSLRGFTPSVHRYGPHSIQGERTAPLAGLWTHQKGGFYLDGRFTTLVDVVDHYDSCLTLGLTAQEKEDVAEYLKSLPQ